ncbi:MAG: DUF6291 domain-containing protein, partial [Prevotellaceae bacterium]|nr:DUF6291 domain-containing protein [Prevotellaceae bacterium]
MERESFVFYKSWAEAIKVVPGDERAAAYEAIINYALYGIEPEECALSARIVLEMARTQIDTNTRRYRNGFKGG